MTINIPGNSSLIGIKYDYDTVLDSLISHIQNLGITIPKSDFITLLTNPSETNIPSISDNLGDLDSVRLAIFKLPIQNWNDLLFNGEIAQVNDLYGQTNGANVAPYAIPSIPTSDQQPDQGTPIEQRRLPVPEDLSNSVIFSTNFYSATDLSNGSVPSNLFDSCGNTDISFTTARDFWLGEISNNHISEPSNNGITIITIQNLTTNYNIGAHTLQFLNWDISSNKNFGENASNNEKMFKGDANNNLANTMQFISGIRTNPISTVDTVNLPLAIVSSNNTYNSFSTISGDSLLNDLSNQFLNYMIVLGRPILVNIANLYDNNSLINIVDNKVNDSPINLINWRSNSPYSSSANNVWIRDNKLYDSESSGNQLHYPLILVPGVIYKFETNTDVSFTFTTTDHYKLDGNTPNSVNTITANTQYELTVTTNKQMNSNFEFSNLTTL